MRGAYPETTGSSTPLLCIVLQIPLNLSTTATLGTIESGCCGEVGVSYDTCFSFGAFLSMLIAINCNLMFKGKMSRKQNDWGTQCLVQALKHILCTNEDSKLSNCPVTVSNQSICGNNNNGMKTCAPNNLTSHMYKVSWIWQVININYDVAVIERLKRVWIVFWDKK